MMLVSEPQPARVHAGVSGLAGPVQPGEAGSGPVPVESGPPGLDREGEPGFLRLGGPARCVRSPLA